MYSKPSFQLCLLFFFIPFIFSSEFENNFNVAPTALLEDNYPTFTISSFSLYNSFVGLLSQGYPDSKTAMDILLKMAAKAQNRTISKCHNYTEEYNNCNNNFTNKSCDSVNEWRRQLRNLTNINNEIQDQLDNLTKSLEKNKKDLKNARKLWRFKNYTLKYMLNKTENKTQLVVKIISLLRSNYSINETLSLLGTNQENTYHKLAKNLLTTKELFTSFNQKFIKTFAKNKDFIKRVSLVKNIIIVLQNLLSKLQNKTTELNQKINQTRIDFYTENERLLNQSDYLNSTIRDLKTEFDSNKKKIDELTKEINDCGSSPSNYEDCQDVFNEKAKKLNNKTSIYLKKIQEFVDKLQNFNRNQTKIIIEIKTCPLINQTNDTSNATNSTIQETEQNNTNETTNNTNKTSMLSIADKKKNENVDIVSKKVGESLSTLTDDVGDENPSNKLSYDNQVNNSNSSNNSDNETNKTNNTSKVSDLIYGEEEDENDDYFLKVEDENDDYFLKAEDQNSTNVDDENPSNELSYDNQINNSNSSNNSDNETNNTSKVSDLIYGEEEDENDDYFLKAEDQNSTNSTNDTKSTNNSNSSNTTDSKKDVDKSSEESDISADSQEAIEKSDEESNIPINEYDDKTKTNFLKETDEDEAQDEEKLNDLKIKILKIAKEDNQENNEEIDGETFTEILAKKESKKKNRKNPINSRTYSISRSSKRKIKK